MNISESKFGKITESFNYDDFYNLTVERLKGYIIDCCNTAESYESRKERNPQFEQYIKDARNAEKKYKEILEDEEKLNKYVALTLTWFVDESINELFYFKIIPKKEFTIHCIDGHTHTFSNEDLDVFKNNSLEAIRKFVYEKAGLEYTPLDEIALISNSIERDKMFRYNGYVNNKPSIRQVSYDSDLDDLIKRTNITSYANLGTKYTANK